MTLEEAIKRYTNNAEYERTHGNLQGCLEFRQLAEWLRALQKYDDVLNKIKAEIEFEIDRRTNMLCAEDVLAIFDKYKAERNE